jgi:hypothetical protein
MADTETDEILVNVTWESDSTDLMNSMNTVANFGTSISNIFTRIMSTSIQLQQSNLTLTRSYWALADAKRESLRWSQQHYELDVQMSQLNVELAQRQLLITQRTGRLLDVEVARLRVSMAQRDATRANWMVEDKRRQVNRGLFMAEEQLNILEKQRSLMLVQITAQFALMGVQMAAVIALIYTQIGAEMTLLGVKSLGLALAPAIIAGAAGYAWAKSMQKEGMEDMPEVPSAQTEIGEVKKITKGGLVKMHKGEVVTRPSISNDNSTHSRTQIININVPNYRTARDVYDELSERRLLKEQPLYYGTPPT